MTGHPAHEPDPPRTWVDRAIEKQRADVEKTRPDGHPATEPAVERVESAKERE